MEEKDYKYKYYAFISYSSKDIGWGKRLQRKLENFSMPAAVCSQHGWKRKPINPVFFAPTDIQPGDLSEELKDRLRASKNLIVICSPNSAHSEWVAREIAFFHSLGREKNIFFFIVSGVPHSGDSQTECFNPIIEQLGLPESLAANINEKIYRQPWLNRERAYVQIISKLLGVEFNSIWQRHKRQLLTRAIAWCVGIVAVLIAMAAIWAANQPFNAEMRIQEASAQNPALPAMHDAKVTLYIDNEVKTDSLSGDGNSVVFRNIPHRFLGKEARVTVACRDFVTLDTTFALSKSNVLSIWRDATVYGRVRTLLFDFKTARPVANTPVTVAGFETRSDSMGYVQLFVPLENQKTEYTIRIPDHDVTSTIYMPVGEDDVIAISK